jgi:hypothetical protein
LTVAHFSDEQQTDHEKHKMNNQPFYEHREGKIPRDIVYFRASTEKNPKGNKQQQREKYFLPECFAVKIFKITGKKQQENRYNHHHVDNDDNGFQVSRITYFLHEIFCEKKLI